MNRYILRLFPILLYMLTCSLVARLYAQSVSIQVQPTAREDVSRNLQRLRAKDAERAAELKHMFEEVGCTRELLLEQYVRPNAPPNVICTMPGETDSVIIVAAHHDHIEAGAGAVDDWSGASLLSSLYLSLKGKQRRHTFRFIGFTEEEQGLAGSIFYVRHLSKEELSEIKAVVNLECLGLGETSVWAHVANKELLDDLLSVTTSMQIKIKGVNVDTVGDDDTHPFRDKHIATVTLHSVTTETFPILHSRKDSLAALDLDRLYESYRVAGVYLAYLDTALK